MFNIGSDKITTGKVLEILFLATAWIVLFWYQTNVDISALLIKPTIFLWMGGFAITMILVGFIITKSTAGKFDFNVPLWDSGFFDTPKAMDKFIIAGAIFMGILTFVGIGFLPKEGGAFALGFIPTTDAPAFQLVEVGTYSIGAAIATVCSAVMEDIFFFGVILGMVYGLTYGFTRNPWIALFTALFLVPLIFMLFHTAVYGFSDVVGMVITFVFGLEQTVIVIFTGKLVWSHMRHGANNAGKLIFTAVTFTGFIISVIGSLWFWVGVIILTPILLFIIRVSRR